MPKKPSKKAAPKRKRGRPPKLDNIKAHWQRAWRLTKSVNPRYAMRQNEQEVAFTYALSLTQKATIVEIGVTHGKTAVLLAYAADMLGGRYIGVDNFSLEGSAKDVNKTLKSRKLTGTILEGNSDQVVWDSPIDYLLIDGGHDRASILGDCTTWLPLVKPGGLVLFHDYNPNIDETDAHYFIKYYGNHFTQTWQKVDFVPYLLIKRKPTNAKRTG